MRSCSQAHSLPQQIAINIKSFFQGFPSAGLMNSPSKSFSVLKHCLPQGHKIPDLRTAITAQCYLQFSANSVGLTQEYERERLWRVDDMIQQLLPVTKDMEITDNPIVMPEE